MRARRTGATTRYVRSHCAFIPTIDRRSLCGAPALTDMAWYLNALVPPLLALGLAGYQARDLAD